LQTLRATTRSFERFESVVDVLRGQLDGGPDPVIAAAFGRAIKEDDLAVRAEELFGDVGRRHELTGELRQRAKALIGQLRSRLARASIESLEPDLVILDEFQRFRSLLSVEEGGESAERAQELFDYGQSKVLLLSATPYKPFTLDQETLASGRATTRTSSRPSGSSTGTRRGSERSRQPCGSTGRRCSSAGRPALQPTE
jgi:hypothetical protein